jgi:hypothetical protein
MWSGFPITYSPNWQRERALISVEETPRHLMVQAAAMAFFGAIRSWGPSAFFSAVFLIMSITWVD